MQKLEPWLVSGVKVAGGLELLSAFAKDLPVSEDLDLSIDIGRLKAPPVSREGLLMLVGVFSTGNNFERRMALRRTWMQYEAVRSGDVAVRFFIGLVSKTLKAAQVNIFIYPIIFTHFLCFFDVPTQVVTFTFLVISFVSEFDRSGLDIIIYILAC